MGKYYKILPKDLICKGFQYQEGLNIDTKKITPYKCDNGLHFADAEDIFDFYSYGPIIAEVEIPEDAIVYHFDNKSKADKIILKNLRPLWNVDTIKDLIRNGAIIETEKDNLLCNASENGYLDVVKYIVEQGANIHIYDDCPLYWASYYGYLDIVKYLVEQGANINVNERIICFTLERGHFDVAEYLIEHGANIHARDDGALRWASEYGHLDVVKYLIEQGANIHALDDEALQQASVYGYFEIVKLLVENGANPHARRGYAIRYAKTPEIKEYLKSVK